jgi:spermidine synthase
MAVSVSAHLLSRKTEFQKIDIYETEAFGKVLFLDGHVQLAELDEHAYHEALVHVPMLSLPEARRALVVGGGDGAVLRELVRYPGLERIDMVEIDAGVIEATREAMPSLSAGAFDDPRVHLSIGDAFLFLKSVEEPYDLIVMDVTDVYEEEDGALSEMLFTAEFYADCARALAENGILVTQADNLIFCPYSLEAILGAFGQAFPATGWYQALVPSFGGFSGYAWASHGRAPAARWPGDGGLGLRYLNETTYALATMPLSFAPWRA